MSRPALAVAEGPESLPLPATSQGALCAGGRAAPLGDECGIRTDGFFFLSF